MAVIGYGVAGEGYGHSIRAGVLGEQLLEAGHQVRFLVGNKSEEYLRKRFGDHPNASFTTIPVLTFIHKGKGAKRRVSQSRTGLFAARYFWNLKSEIKKIAAAYQFDLIISDYDPLSGRLAAYTKTPLITVDSQHYYVFSSTKKVPLRFLPYHIGIRASCWIFSPKKEYSVVCHFRNEGFKKTDRAEIIGPLVRKEIREAKRTPEDHVLVYTNPLSEAAILPVLAESGERAHIFGLGARPEEELLSFHDFSDEEFMYHLLHAKKIIAAGGSTLSAECLFLEAPFLCIPMKNQKEQELNGIFLRKMGVDVVLKDDLGDAVAKFLHKDDFNYQVSLTNGSKRVFEIIQNYIDNNLSN